MSSTSFKTWATFKMVFQRFGCMVRRKTAAREHALACPANTVRYGCNKKVSSGNQSLVSTFSSRAPGRTTAYPVWILQSPHVGPCKVFRRNDTIDAIGVHGVATTVFVDRLNPAYVIQHWSRFTSSNSLQNNSFRTAIRLSGLPAGTADSPGGGVVDATYYSCHKDVGHNIRNIIYSARSFYCTKEMTRCSVSSRSHNSLLGTGEATSVVRILYSLEINFTTCV